MKIAIIYDPIYPYVIGGGENRNWEIAKRLAKNSSYQVYLIGMKYWEGHKEIIKEGVHLVGVCRAIPLYNKKGSRSLFEPFYFGFYVFRHLLGNSYDIIDCGNFPYLSCIAIRLAILCNRCARLAKFIITWHEIWGKRQWINYAGKIGIIGWFIEKVVSRLSRYNIFVSEFMRERGVNILGIKRENTVVIANGVEYNRLSEIEDIKKESQIIYVGRLIEHKRVDLLIEAFSDVVKKFSEYSLKIVGNGPEYINLELKIKNLELTDKVIFTGFLERSNLEKEIKKSKILILPSEREGMGIVIVESMGLGTPVIALDSEYSAAKCIIRNGDNGILVKNRNEMSDAIIRLLTDDELYNKLIDNGYQTAKSYDWDSVIIPTIVDYYGINKR